MKKLFLLLVISAMVGTVAVAQEQKEAKEKPKQEQKDMKKERAEWDKKLKDELKLTEEQAVKYDAISKECNDKIDAIANDATLDKAVQKEKKMALKKEKETKLLEILTAEQQATYNAIIEKKKKEMAAKPGA